MYSLRSSDTPITRRAGPTGCTSALADCTSAAESGTTTALSVSVVVSSMVRQLDRCCHGDSLSLHAKSESSGVPAAPIQLRRVASQVS